VREYDNRAATYSSASSTFSDVLIVGLGTTVDCKSQCHSSPRSFNSKSCLRASAKGRATHAGRCESNQWVLSRQDRGRSSRLGLCKVCESIGGSCAGFSPFEPYGRSVRPRRVNARLSPAALNREAAVHFCDWNDSGCDEWQESRRRASREGWRYAWMVESGRRISGSIECRKHE